MAALAHRDADTTGPESQFEGATMHSSRLHPQLRRSFRFAPGLPIGTRFGRALIQRVLGLRTTSTTFEGVAHTIVALPSGLHVRVFTPGGGGSGAALLNIHGGGMVVGIAAQDDGHMAEVARKLDVIVISVEYRLAPEHPFPAALDDCLAGWKWLVDTAEEMGVDPQRIAIGGQSAGGGLAATLTQRLHDQDGPQPVAQWLFCPMLDDRTAARRELDAVKNPVWTNRTNRAGWRAYLGQEPGAARVPQYAVATRRGDLTGLPPAWIGVGDCDLFLDECVAYATALHDAGVPTTLDVVAGAPHAFETAAPDAPLSVDYKARAHGWLASHLGV